MNIFPGLHVCPYCSRLLHWQWNNLAITPDATNVILKIKSPCIEQQQNSPKCQRPVDLCNIKVSSNRHRKSHSGNKTILRLISTIEFSTLLRQYLYIGKAPAYLLGCIVDWIHSTITVIWIWCNLWLWFPVRLDYGTRTTHLSNLRWDIGTNFHISFVNKGDDECHMLIFVIASNIHDTVLHLINIAPR